MTTELTIEAARRGLPPETLFAAMGAASIVDAGDPVALRGISLGNMTALEVALMPLTEFTGGLSGAPAGQGFVLVTVVGFGSWALAGREGGPLHWSYVEEHLIHNRCDATALTLFLATALHREPLLNGGCDCGRHGIEEA